MGFAEVLTLILIALKLTDNLDDSWTWTWVYSPLIASAVFYAVVLAIYLWITTQ